MDRVVEILQIPLVEAEGSCCSHAAEDVAHIVKRRPPECSRRSGKAQFHVIEEQCIASEGKPVAGADERPARDQRRADIARTGLIVRKGAQRVGAATEEASPGGRTPFGQTGRRS